MKNGDGDIRPPNLIEVSKGWLWWRYVFMDAVSTARVIYNWLSKM